LTQRINGSTQHLPSICRNKEIKMSLTNISHARPFVFATVLTLSAAALAMGSHPVAGDDEAVAARIKPVAHVEFASDGNAGSSADSKPVAQADKKPESNKVAGNTAAAGGRSGEEIVKASCSACHQSGVAGAPKIGDKAAWAPRLVQGLDGLVKSATAGKNAMPPRGASNASEIELTRAIIYMTNKSGASFKEPGEAK